jgi:hypothetical protein
MGKQVMQVKLLPTPEQAAATTTAGPGSGATASAWPKSAPNSRRRPRNRPSGNSRTVRAARSGRSKTRITRSRRRSSQRLNAPVVVSAWKTLPVSATGYGSSRPARQAQLVVLPPTPEHHRLQGQTRRGAGARGRCPAHLATVPAVRPHRAGQPARPQRFRLSQLRSRWTRRHGSRGQRS